jgi:hypothetical protein
MDALANVSRLGVCELQEDDLREVDGGSRLFYDAGQYMYKILHQPEPNYKIIIKNRVIKGKMCLSL